ncbi:extracellular solute-binding protein [Bifidobacterium sp. SO4]|uniref:extracellular solute-binding protein n=1 Tax=Bifidobacterium sp. SO4 TaxID=2809030 RepID=UPI001BDDA977|nr:extracellular solute-binding protein [Bifidobacterium sp. SO4]MBT1170623.1 extracellular solute-binding protein [Bifidobacterium sp. SO4]
MKRSMFKAATAVVASVAMLAGMAGCGRTNTANAGGDDVTTIDSNKASGELTIWAMGNEGDLLGDFVKDFESENPDVKVKVTAIPWASAHDKLQTAIATGEVPDVAQMGNTFMADFSNAFSEVPSNLDLSVFFEGPVENYKVGGKQLGVPWYVDTRVLYYRTDIAEKAGITEAPKTWDELKTMAEAMQKVSGVDYGMRINASGTDCFGGILPFAYSAGASLTDSNESKWTIDSDAMNRALDYVTGYYKDGIADVNADVNPGANIADFVAGTTPMMLEGPTAVSQIEELGGNDIKDKYATVTLPAMDSSSDMGTSYLGGSGLVTFSEAKNKDAAWKFIRWASQPDVQAKWYTVSSDLPAAQKTWSNDALTASKTLTAFGDQLKHAQGVPAFTTWAQFSSAADRAFEQIAKGQTSVADGLKSLQSEADSIGIGE